MKAFCVGFPGRSPLLVYSVDGRSVVTTVPLRRVPAAGAGPIGRHRLAQDGRF